MKKAYLLAYNGFSAALWAFCVVKAGIVLSSGGAAGQAWEQIRTAFVLAQTAMLLDIAHAAIGLVPSPVMVVAMQVGSRIFVLWGHLYFAPECQKHWSLWLIVFSWGTTEVVRYLFYAFALLGSVPYPLFYLRYSLFMALYPSGITGEIFQVLVAMGALWKGASPLWYRASALVLLTYIPAGPGMILNMWGNRKRSFKKRAEAGQKQLSGIVWPETKKGDRSSTSTNRAILAAAQRAGPGREEAAATVTKEKNWRFGYRRHLVTHMRQSLEGGKEPCLAMAKAGLEAAQSSFKFCRAGEPERSLAAAMGLNGEAGTAATAFDTAALAGAAKAPERPELGLLYGGPTAGKPYYRFADKRKQKVTGLKLREQVDAWQEYGTIEEDAAQALKLVQQNQEKWLDLQGQHFVLLGAGSAMGPLQFLLEHGATVVAVARSRVLKKLMQQMKGYSGKLLFPVKPGCDWQKLLAAEDWDGLAAVSGCDLLTQTPEIAAWLEKAVPADAPVTVGNYTYLDGALHVQVSVACDCLMERMCRSRGTKVSLAFLGTPTDVTLVPKAAAEAAAKAREGSAWWMKLWESAGVLKKTVFGEAGGHTYLDSIVVDQGPNYILAKRIQHWRAMLAHSAGHTVSSNVSPSTATASVTSNLAFAAAYGGMHLFRPLEVAYEELSASLCAALLVHDIKAPRKELQHPLQLFQTTSAHFGVWRCPYSITSIGVPSVLSYAATAFWPHLSAAMAVAAVMTRYLLTGALPLGDQLPGTPHFLVAGFKALSVPL